MFRKDSPTQDPRLCPNCEGKGIVPALIHGGTAVPCWVCKGNESSPENEKQKPPKPEKDR